MKASDFVVVSLSLNEETKKIISKDLIDKMKRTAIFVNVGRGGRSRLSFCNKITERDIAFELDTSKI